MALFNVSLLWQRSRFTLQWLIINLVGSLACLSAVALAQFEWSEGVSGSVSIPDVAFTCIGNLGVFMTAFMRGRLDMENGARDVLATTRGPNLNAINGSGLDMESGDGSGVATTRGPKVNAINRSGLSTRPSNDLGNVDVIMLANYNQRPHSSLTQFMQYISHSHGLESILLQVLPFTPAAGTEERCQCVSERKCRCVVLWATNDIMIMLAHRLPGTLKRLPESRCLLLSVFCLKNGCHGCLPDVEATGESSKPATSERRLEVDNPRVDFPAAVCEALEDFTIEEESSCIFIPIRAGNADRWTKFMIKFLKSKEKEAKGIKVMASEALQKYTTQSTQELGFSFPTRTGVIVVTEIYESASLILPRVAEVLVNIVLTGWLRLDGFSSSLVSRRAIRDYVVDSTGTGFAANAFLTEAVIFCSRNGSNVCQLLRFRGGLLSARRVSYIVGCVNVFCSIAWSVLIACEGNWAPSMPLSTPRVAVILGAVGVALGMDCFEFYWAPVRTRALAGACVRFEDRAQAWALARARAQARDRGRAQAQAQARDRALVWVRAQAAQVQVQAQAQVQALAQAQSQALAQAQAQSQALAQARAQVEALAQGQVGAQVEALAQGQDEDEFEALDLVVAQDGALEMVVVPAQPLEVAKAKVQTLAVAEAKAKAEVEVLDLALAQAQAQAQAPVPVLAEAEAEAEADAEARALALGRGRAWARVQARFRGLEPGVILEVGCIVSLVVSLIMNVGLGKWVYSVMQVLVWVKWGIGSFLLGDMATEDELVNLGVRIGNNGTWVYCSAFLLNAMLAGVRRKWVYYVNL